MFPVEFERLPVAADFHLTSKERRSVDATAPSDKIPNPTPAILVKAPILQLFKRFLCLIVPQRS